MDIGDLMGSLGMNTKGLDDARKRLVDFGNSVNKEMQSAQKATDLFSQGVGGSVVKITNELTKMQRVAKLTVGETAKSFESLGIFAKGTGSQVSKVTSEMKLAAIETAKLKRESEALALAQQKANNPLGNLRNSLLRTPTNVNQNYQPANYARPGGISYSGSSRQLPFVPLNNGLKSSVDAWQLYKNAAQQATYVTDQFGNATRKVTQSGRGMNDWVIGVAKGMLLYKGLSVVLNVLTEAIKAPGEASREFEKNFANVKRLFEGTPEEFNKMGKEFRQLAKEIPLPLEEILKLGAAAGQLGIEKENVVAFTRTMGMLGKTADNLNSEESAMALAKFANIADLAKADFDKLASAILYAGTKSATTEKDVVNLGQRIVATGKQMGMSNAQVVAWAAAISSVGVRVYAGGTAFNTILASMDRAVATNSNKLKLYNSIVPNFANLFRTNASNALNLFVEALGKMDKSSGKTTLTLDRLGLKNAGVTRTLLSLANGHKIINPLIEGTSNAYAKGTYAMEQFKIKTDTADARIQLFKNTMHDWAITVGDSFLTVTKKTFDWAAKTVASVNAVTVALGTLTSVAVIGGLISLGGKLTNLWLSFSYGLGTIEALKGGVMGLAAAFPILITAVTATIAVFTGWKIGEWIDKFDLLGTHAESASKKIANTSWAQARLLKAQAESMGIDLTSKGLGSISPNNLSYYSNEVQKIIDQYKKEHPELVKVNKELKNQVNWMNEIAAAEARASGESEKLIPYLTKLNEAKTNLEAAIKSAREGVGDTNELKTLSQAVNLAQKKYDLMKEQEKLSKKIYKMENLSAPISSIRTMPKGTKEGLEHLRTQGYLGPVAEVLTKNAFAAMDDWIKQVREAREMELELKKNIISEQMKQLDFEKEMYQQGMIFTAEEQKAAEIKKVNFDSINEKKKLELQYQLTSLDLEKELENIREHSKTGSGFLPFLLAQAQAKAKLAKTILEQETSNLEIARIKKTIDIEQEYRKEKIMELREIAGTLFDDLLSGNENIWSNLLNSFKRVFLKPAKEAFQKYFQSLLFNSDGSAKGEDSTSTSGGLTGFISGLVPMATKVMGPLALAGQAAFSKNPYLKTAGIVGMAGAGLAAASTLMVGGGTTLFTTVLAAAAPMIAAAAGAAMAGVAIANAVIGDDSYESGSKQIKKAFGVNFSAKQYQAFVNSLGMNEAQAWGVRADLNWSPKMISENIAPLAKDAGKIDQLLKAAETASAGHNVVNMRPAIEIGILTNNWDALNKVFKETAGFANLIESKIPGITEKLMAGEEVLKPYEQLIVNFNNLGTSIKETITSSSKMYDTFLSTGDITEKLSKQIQDVNGNLAAFEKLSSLTKISTQFSELITNFINTGEVTEELTKIITDFGGSVELLSQMDIASGMSESVTFISNLVSELKNLAPELDPINQILSGKIGTEALAALNQAGLDVEQITKLTNAINAKNVLGDLEAFPRMTEDIKNALLNYGGDAGATAIANYANGINTITTDLLKSVTESMNAAFYAELSNVTSYLTETQTTMEDTLKTLMENINAQFTTVGDAITASIDIAKQAVVDAINQIILSIATTEGGAAAATSSLWNGAIAVGSTNTTSESTTWPGYTMSPEEQAQKLWQIQNNIPTLAEGGSVAKTGWAVVHEGETYSGIGKSLGKGDIHIHLEGATINGVDDLDNKLMLSAKRLRNRGFAFA